MRRSPSTPRSDIDPELPNHAGTLLVAAIIGLTISAMIAAVLVGSVLANAG